MKKNIRKTMSTILSLAMVLSLLNVQGLTSMAEETELTAEEVTEAYTEAVTEAYTEEDYETSADVYESGDAYEEFEEVGEESAEAIFYTDTSADQPEEFQEGESPVGETEPEEEIEPWDGYFTNEHPEWGGILYADISGLTGGTLTIEIPENAFTEAVTAGASAEIFTMEDLENGLLEETDASVLEKVLSAAEETIGTEYTAYDFYELTLTFYNDAWEQVQPNGTITVTADLSASPVDLQAQEILFYDLYLINGEMDTAEEMWNLLTLTETNELCGMVFTAYDCSSPFVVFMAGPAAEVPEEDDAEAEAVIIVETEPETEAEVDTEAETEEAAEEEAAETEEIESEEAAEAETESETETGTKLETESETEESAEKVYTAGDGGVMVTVTAQKDALPEDAYLQVVLYGENSNEYADAAEAIGLDPEEAAAIAAITDESGIQTLAGFGIPNVEGTALAVVDISFIADGEEVEPSEPVEVKIDASAIIPAGADITTVEIQHLEKSDDGVTPVEVASGTTVAEFELESFSSFTITWAGNAAGGNTTEVTVYLYDINGLGIYDEDEQGTYEWASGTHTIANLIEEHVSGKIGDGYTYAYATVQYLTTSAMGGSVKTIGSAEDPVVSISWNGTNYTITTSTGSTTVASSDADEFYINLYFSTPMVSISVTGADTTNHTVSLTADTEYFQNSDITYTWEITSGSEYASITENGANATVTWNAGDEAGTDITVKVTATSVSGETATATYDLEYGMTQVTYTVYYDSGRTLAAGAHVAIYDENGKLVSNGEADENGQVTLWVVPGTTYTLEASFTTSSGSGIAMTYTHYSYEDTNYVYVGDGTDNTTINLETSDANFYEHVDVKLSIADEDAGYSDILSNVDYVKIYDEAGELVYQSSEMVHNEGTNDYNVLFADADGNEGDNPHSIAFYDTYTIEIAYEVSYTYTDSNGNETEYTESYVATIDSSSTYMDGEYYSYNGTNAYQLYNTIYGTSYTADTFATAVANQTLEDYNEHGISLDGLTYFYVAAALCDTKDMTGQAGLDLALGVNSLRRYSSTTWNFDVQKTLKNSGADAGAFSFSLYSATVNESTWLVNVSDDYEFTLSNGTMIMADGSTESVANMAGFFAFDYDSTMVGQTQTYYFVLVEDAGDNENITYSDAVYGIKVEVTLNSSTDMNDVMITETAYNLTESESGDEANRTFTQGEEFDGSEDEDGYTIFPFENTYRASGSVDFGVTKTVTGRDSTTKSFTFALYSADEEYTYSDDTLIDTENTTGTLTGNTAQSVIFDTSKVEYTEGGTYYYVIKETTNSGNGWTCDGTEYYITVTAANDGSGNIVPTEVTYTYVDSEGETQSGTLTADEDGVYGISGDSTLSFVNTYSDAESDVIFGGTKSITGTNSTTAIFAFGLYETGSDFVVSDDSEVHATTVTGSGNFAFEEIDYTTAGTYYYVVKETTEDGSGWTVDGTEYHITVVVADDATSDEGTGAFTITVSCTDAEGNTVELTQTQDEENGIYTITGLDLENEYDASGSLNLTATKEYIGATLAANQFNFTITETTDGATYTGTGTNDAVGNITFTPAIEYGLSDVGTHTYEIAETAGNAGGVTYDSNKITVTVEVADAGNGTLTATVTVDDREITAGTDGSYNVGTFNNIYEATGGVTLTATKTYTGATMTAGQFEFQIAETSGRYIGTGTNDADGNITFSPEITYTLDDVGTHTYRIVEVNGSAGGVTYDDSEIIVTVVVANNGDGTLSTTVTVDGEGVTAGDDGAYNVGTFENSYEATGSVTFGGVKTISGKDVETSQQFTFELYTTDSDFTVAENAEATDTQTVTGAGSFTFETISYDSDEEGNGAGTYYYVVKETATNENGWTSDTKEYRITVVVVDAGNGTFALTVTCVDAEGQTVVLTGTDANGVYNFTGLDFTNEYEPAPTSVQFTGSKYITNSASDSESTNKVFTFELYNADSSFATDGDAVQTKTTTGAGNITFDKIEYEETGTHYYVIQEKALDEAGGWTIDPTVYNITVEVTDDGLGQLVATVTEVTKGTVTGTYDVYGGFDFTNAYAAEGEVTLGVVKSISGVASTDKTFSFTLYNSDESFATGDSIETITTDGEITNSTQLNFTAIPYTKAGTYYYLITETGTAPDGWTLDTEEYHVTVTVTDNGDGTLTTSASYAYIDEAGETQTENSAAFTNTYTATGSLSLTGTKTFTGGTLTEDAFTFTMTDSTGESVGDVTMDAGGTITFPTLTYDETNIGGEYTYTITEVAGTDSSVQYDDTTYTVVVSVDDNGDGTLDVTYKVNGTESGDITFANYQMGSLRITKAFTGLTDDQIASLTDFTITVTNSNDETVATLILEDADEGSSYTWTISNLPADTYTLTETGYSLDGYEIIAKSGEVTITNGSDISVGNELAWGATDTVGFSNDYTEVGSLNVSKYVVESSNAANLQLPYSVTITAQPEEGESVDLQWITVTVDDIEIDATIDSDAGTINFALLNGQTVNISGLPVGSYTVEENYSATRDDFHPIYRVGEHETVGVPTVEVSSDSESLVTVEIDNEFPVGTYIQVRKSYNGAVYPTGYDAFTFTIEALSCDLEEEDLTMSAAEMPMPTNSIVTVTNGNSATFGQMEFDYFGTYYYKITETKGSLDYVGYDSSVYYVKVVVTDSGETADEGYEIETVVESYAKADAETNDYKDLDYTEAETIVTAEFTNIYSAEGGITLTATKEYTGADLTEGLFNFTITETTAGATYTGTGANDADGNITFTPAIEYTLDDVGTHTYVITEIAGKAGGVTYDFNTITVTVVVTDNNDGTLVTTVTVDGVGVTTGDDSAYNVGTFENSYKATGDVTLTATKTISGMDSTVKTFNFTLYNSNEDFTYNIGDTRSTASTTSTLTEGEAQTVTFPTITYSEAGTYYFVIVESSTGTEGDGWTYDGTEYHVTVVMTDDGNGNLIPAVTYTYVDENEEKQSASSADFTNTYKAAETSVQFAGTKYISNSNSTDKAFAFELYEVQDSSFDITGVKPEEVKTSGSIDASGQSYEFSEITYKEAGTHYYVIKEQELDEANGWTISETVYYITLEVTDNQEGQLVATVSYVTEIGGDSTTVTGSEDVYDGFDFTNTYAASGSVGFTAVKSLSGRATSDTTFTFALYNSDASFAEGSQIETKSTSDTIEASQQVSFTEIEYEYDSSNTYPMNYYYIIKETTTDGSGWTCDTGEYHVTVTVTDDGTGTLTTSPSYVYLDADGEESSADNATFKNTYAATGALSLSGTKTFEGGTITDGQFTYTVMEGEKQVATGTVAADGTITFTQIDYTYSDVGEHTYTITEDAGSDTSVQYDTTEYTVVATVTDNETGELAVSYTVNGEESGSIAFTNYQKGSLTISKTFTGLTDEQIESLTDFTITVTNSEDETMAILTLDDADEGSSYTWTLSDLEKDTYTVTESGYSLDGYEVIAKSGEVEVTDGSDVSVDDTLAWGGTDTVEITNDYTEVGAITISKYVTAEEDIQKAHEDTEYTIVITSNENADFQWVSVTSDVGREVTPTIDGKTITFTITENETVTISGLPAGEYTVEEQGSDAMTSEHCVPTYIVGEEETEEAPAVTVASGDENIVAVEIDNEYPIGTYIMVQKEYNKAYPTGDDAFTFTIEALTADLDAGGTLNAKDMPIPEEDTVTINNSDGRHIAVITFDDEENEFEYFGTYYYKITETKGSLENVEYDESVHYVKVVVAFDETTHVVTTDEWEAKAEAETDDYKNLEYTEAGIVTAEFTNTAYEELSIEKEVAGDAGDTSEYEFEITLTNSDGTPYEGEVTVTSDNKDDDSSNGLAVWFSGIIRAFAESETSVTFEDGKATVTVSAGEKVTLMVPSGVTCTITETTTGADSTTVYDGNGDVVVQAKGTTTEATAEVGTIADSTQVKFVNSYRAYYPIDEEIVTDEDDIFDRDAWVKDEAVNEYNAIEIEMTTNLPVVTAYDLENGSFTMNFHEVLDHELILDEEIADFSVYIAGYSISPSYYSIAFGEDTGDDCNFHVDVDLTALFEDGIVTEDMLDGNTEITIFFFADLEGTGLNGSYKSTVWYDIYDEEELLYTSNVSVVEVYTYEIEILKYDASTLEGDDYAGSALAGATLGIYYDEECTDPVSRNGEPYTQVSEEDGMVIFYGLADGTYYIMETEAPDGYVLSDEILEVVLDEGLNDSGYAYEAIFANTPEESEEPEEPEKPVKGVDTNDDHVYDNDGTTVKIGQTVEYEISYTNTEDEAVSVIFTDTLTDELDYVSGGSYDESSRTITWPEIEVAAGESVSVTFKATINESAADVDAVKNTAEMVYADNPDVIIQTNTVENPVEPELEPDEPRNPEKDIDVGNGTEVCIGDELTYTISFYNHYDEAVEVTVTDLLDTGLDFVRASDDGDYDEDTRTITWTVVADAESYGEVSFIATVNETAIIQVENDAEVQIWNDSAVSTNKVENPLEEESEETEGPVKGIDTNDDQVYDNNGAAVKIGQTVEYEISYTNTEDEAVSVIFTDTLTDELDYVSGGSYDESSRTITWPEIEVAAGETVSVTFEAAINEKAADVDTVDNTAEMAFADNPEEKIQTNTVENPVELGETEPEETEPGASEEPVKGVDTNDDQVYDNDGETVKIGQTVKYEITFYNYYDEAVEVTVTDELDTGLDFVSATDDGTYDENTRTITWTVVAGAGSYGSVSFAAMVNENAVVEVENTAGVQIWSDNTVTTNTVENPLEEETEESEPQESESTETEESEPEATEPEPPEPESTEPETSEPEANGAGAPEPEETGTETSDSEGTEAEASETETPESEEAETEPPIDEEEEESVETGDNTPINAAAGLMALAVVLILGAFTYRKRRMAK